ncbi:hypothetical protein ACFC0C_16145 [Streptomyces sp. NPDC056178]|uniref:hypothetical protein n=1 Tax=unclassified Streptomyces TaxID=2593676 RepID=UPI0035DAA92C
MNCVPPGVRPFPLPLSVNAAFRSRQISAQSSVRTLSLRCDKSELLALACCGVSNRAAQSHDLGIERGIELTPQVRDLLNWPSVLPF